MTRSIEFYIGKQDWFRALLLHLVEDGGSLKSFMLQYDVKGCEKEVKETFHEIKRKSRIKWEYHVQGGSRLRFGYRLLKYRVFKDPEKKLLDYLLESKG